MENESLHLVTEVMVGGELADAFEHLEMTEQNVRLIAVQLASAIAHLHLAHSMAHRDGAHARARARPPRSPPKVLWNLVRARHRLLPPLTLCTMRAGTAATVKPQNVLCRSRRRITQVGSLKLADFGFCAPFVDRATPCFELYCGSPDYFAPELAVLLLAARRHEPTTQKYGAAVDCWAIGAILYEMLHGCAHHSSPLTLLGARVPSHTHAMRVIGANILHRTRWRAANRRTSTRTSTRSCRPSARAHRPSRASRLARSAATASPSSSVSSSPMPRSACESMRSAAKTAPRRRRARCRARRHACAHSRRRTHARGEGGAPG